jgi:hypothetical protein
MRKNIEYHLGQYLVIISKRLWRSSSFSTMKTKLLFFQLFVFLGMGSLISAQEAIYQASDSALYEQSLDGQNIHLVSGVSGNNVYSIAEHPVTGDFYLFTGGNSPGEVVRITTGTLERTVISQDVDQTSPTLFASTNPSAPITLGDSVITADDKAYVARFEADEDDAPFPAGNSIIEVDLTTGQRRVLYSDNNGSEEVTLTTLDVETSGSLLAAGFEDISSSSTNRVIVERVDTISGNRQRVAEMLTDYNQIEFSSATFGDSNDLYMIAKDYPGFASVSLFQAHLGTGVIDVVSTGTTQFGIRAPARSSVYHTDGFVYTFFYERNKDDSNNRIVQIDPVSGAQNPQPQNFPLLISAAPIVTQAGVVVHYGRETDIATDPGIVELKSVLRLGDVDEFLFAEPSRGAGPVFSARDTLFKLSTGDFAAYDSDGYRLMKIDRLTGDRTLLADNNSPGDANTLFDNTFVGITEDANNGIITLVFEEFVSFGFNTTVVNNRFISVNPDTEYRSLANVFTTGKQTGTGRYLNGIIYDPVRRNFIAAPAPGCVVGNPTGIPIVPGALISFDPVTNTETVLGGYSPFASAFDFQFDKFGKLVFLQGRVGCLFTLIIPGFTNYSGERALYTYDIDTETSTIITSNSIGAGDTFNPSDLAITESGRYFAINFNQRDGFIEVDTVTGDRLPTPLTNINGAKFLVAPSTLSTEPTTGTISLGDTPEADAGDTGVTYDFSANDTVFDLEVETMIGNPPGLTNAMPRYWRIDAPGSGTFSTRLTFTYLEADRWKARLDENTLRLMKSDDGGASWMEIPAAFDPVSNETTTINEQTSFSLWAIAGDEVTNVESWDQY